MHIRMDVRSGALQVSVKDHTLWAHDARCREAYKELSQSTIDAIYEATKEDFWHEADQIANQMGYGEAYAEGRSGGWLEASGGPRFPGGIDYASEEYKRFEEFAKQIMEVKANYKRQFIEELAEEVNDLNNRREAAIVRSNN